MSATQYNLDRRQLLGALAAIGGGSAAISAGTYATFSDTESSSDSIETDSIVLDTGSQTLSFTTNDIEPGASGSSSVVLESAGTAGGRLDVSIANVSNTDEVSTKPEEDAEAEADEDSIPLADQLEVKMWVEEASPDSGEGQFDDTSDYGLKEDGTVAHGDGATLNFADVSDFPSQPTYQTMTFADDSPTDKEFFVEWKLPQDATNAVQGDKTTIDFDFTLNQA
ncbi:hypothetical protein DJ69_10825 [Halorubrum persicum]|uniref:SipW-cognate class signal peptide n=1 Tax=Halorubrum persicum TaxID=1383844 RepID=A0A2G1WI97_9EURY|nr:SipW-dependent-type signal peptide-containing protein [Halorubrum persicum]PHQ38579.1 hypothetical protein DJ69_10825 [Halorubrum persicum]